MSVLPSYAEALAVVLEHQKASPSLIQRKLQIGYNLAMDFIERMEAEGVCAKPNSAGLRVLLGNAEPPGSACGGPPDARDTGPGTTNTNKAPQSKADIIKRLREAAPRLASMGVVLSELAKHLASVIPTPRDAETVTRSAALLSEAAQLLERGSWKPSEGAVARIIDPEAWAYFDKDVGQHNAADLLRFDAWKQSSLTKARAILALSPDPAFLGEIADPPV